MILHIKFILTRLSTFVCSFPQRKNRTNKYVYSSGFFFHAGFPVFLLAFAPIITQNCEFFLQGKEIILCSDTAMKRSILKSNSSFKKILPNTSQLMKNIHLAINSQALLAAILLTKHSFLNSHPIQINNSQWSASSKYHIWKVEWKRKIQIKLTRLSKQHTKLALVYCCTLLVWKLCS